MAIETNKLLPQGQLIRTCILQPRHLIGSVHVVLIWLKIPGDLFSFTQVQTQFRTVRPHYDQCQPCANIMQHRRLSLYVEREKKFYKATMSISIVTRIL